MSPRRVLSKARAYSEVPLLPEHSDDLPYPERARSPGRRSKVWRWRSAVLRRKELYVLLLLGLAYYGWSIERMWDQEWRDWKQAAAVERPTAPDFETGSAVDMAYSHNDEMQGTHALALALSLGFGAIEVDTWLVDGPQEEALQQLIIGHKSKDLAGRSFQSVYLDPMLEILDDRNRERNATAGDWVGLYEHNPRLEVQLVIDFKSNGEAMWPYVNSALEPLRASGYLTTYDVSSSTWTPGAIRVIGTGNTPLSHVYHSPLRYIFFDAHLLDLSRDTSIPVSAAGPAATFDLTPEIAPMASAKFPILYHLGIAMPPGSIIQRYLGKYTAEARRRGIRSRWWGAARYPAFLRRRLWMMMQKGGLDWVGGDDLADLAAFMRRL